MTGRSRTLQGVAAAVGVALVGLWPVLLISRAGASGSVGDLSEVRFGGLGVAYQLVLAVLAGWVMAGALRRSAISPELGRLDPWGAYALGLGVYSLVATLVPAAILGWVLVDENASIRDRGWLVYLLWFGGHLAAALAAFGSARALLGRRLVRDPVAGREPGRSELTSAASV
ncbi:MAG: hypothetical protein S0880_21865 [Actinomycetota bacterium]|nr:hypothetical protein [Actinomycetota bacterium]